MISTARVATCTVMHTLQNIGAMLPNPSPSNWDELPTSRPLQWCITWTELATNSMARQNTAAAFRVGADPKMNGNSTLSCRLDAGRLRVGRIPGRHCNPLSRRSLRGLLCAC